MERKRFTLDLTEQEAKFWRQFAANVGFHIGRGPYAKNGSIQKLFEAAAAGDVVLYAERTIKSDGSD